MSQFRMDWVFVLLLVGCQISNSSPKVTVVQAPPIAPSPSLTHIALTGKIQAPGPTQVEIENTAYTTTTDRDGNFHLPQLPVAEAKHLRAFYTQSDGSRLATRREIVPSAATLDLGTLLLAPTGAIVGVISTPVATDLTGTTVYIAGTSLAARTDAQGNYFLPQVPAGVYTVTVERPNYGRVQGIVQVESGQPAPLHLEIRSEEKVGSYLTGQVNGPEGAMAGVLLQLEGQGTTLSDAQGQFRLGPLPDGEYILYARREGFAPLMQTVKVPNAVSLALTPQPGLRTGNLTGQVLDSQGLPISRAQIVLEPMVTSAVTTDANGRFQFETVWPGSYYLKAQDQGQIKASTFASVASGQVVDIPVQGVISVNGLACLQTNHNQIAVEAPGAQVTVNVTNTNTCTITPQNK